MTARTRPLGVGGVRWRDGYEVSDGGAGPTSCTRDISMMNRNELECKRPTFGWERMVRGDAFASQPGRRGKGFGPVRWTAWAEKWRR